MSMISEHLKSEIIDPTLPRDSFVPPEYEDGDFDEDLPEYDEGDDDVE